MKISDGLLSGRGNIGNCLTIKYIFKLDELIQKKEVEEAKQNSSKSIDKRFIPHSSEFCKQEKILEDINS